MNFLLALALMAPASPGAVVVKPVANMYSAATEDADVVSQAICGTSVVLIEEKDEWVKVRTPDDYPGWMLLASLRRYGPGDRPYASTGKVVQVASLLANVYREPSVTKHQPMLTLPFEARLEVVEERVAQGSPSSPFAPLRASSAAFHGPTQEPQGQNAGPALRSSAALPPDARRWLQVRLPDERTAWIQRGDVDSDPAPLGVQGAIELAKRFLGLTYLWGGTSAFGFDCSGFTQMLVRRRGILMPRDAGVQAAWQGVVVVQRNKLRAGDLLFFGESPQKITHTGMYIGHGKFIHDTTHEHPGVQISRLGDEHWTKLLVACRRLK
jgi:cell wall-associated NlpC family hydrolase